MAGLSAVAGVSANVAWLLAPEPLPGCCSALTGFSTPACFDKTMPVTRVCQLWVRARSKASLDEQLRQRCHSTADLLHAG